jgi:hypothetical protein
MIRIRVALGAAIQISLPFHSSSGAPDLDVPPFLTISRLGTNVFVVWAFHDLQSATTLQGP